MKKIFLGIAIASAISGCATEQSRTIEVTKVQAASTPFQGERSKVSIGRFENKSTYLSGIFSDGVDRIGIQAKSVLIAHLQQTGRFNVLDRDNLNETAREAGYANKGQTIKASEFVITGAVSEFGRKVTGDQQLFGILGRAKSQIAYAKVTLNVVNVQTTEVIYSVQGAGEYSLSDREVIGFGGTSGYDSTLSGKVLDLAIKEAVNNLSQGMDSGAIRLK
jgi:curli biogenesis system outer membrane secretion channel CsgG